MSHSGTLIPFLPRRHSLGVMLSVSVSALWGCASPGPEIDRYEMRSSNTDKIIADWGNEAWDAAVLGDDEAALQVLRHPPGNLANNASKLAEQFVAARQSLMDQRAIEARELLALTVSTDSDNIADQLMTIEALGDIHLAGLDDAELQAEVTNALHTMQASLIESATQAEDRHDWIDATTQWMMLESLASDLDEPENINRARREYQVTSMIADWTDPASLDETRAASPTIYIRILEILAERHVARPDWRPLIEAGMEMMLLRADPRKWGGEVTDPKALDAFLTRLNTIIDECRMELASHPDMDGTIPPRTRNALRNMLRRIQLATDGRDLPSFRMLARAFIMGAAFETDSRSGMIWPERMEELNRSLGRDYVGIGAMIESGPGPSARLEPMDGGPARQAGIRTGDRLLAVDGQMIEELTTDQVVSRVLGPRGTSVTLTLERDGTPEPFDITVVRRKIIRPNVTGWRQIGIGPGGNPSWDWLVQPELGVVYLRIDQFTTETEPEFRTALRQASDRLGPNRQIEGLVIDLRDNPGGNKDTASALLDLFITIGTTYREDNDESRNWDFARHGVTRLSGMPTVILMNEKSASASELVAGTLQARCNAVVIGERSYGKGSVQSLHPVGGGIMKVTTAWYMVPLHDRSQSDLDYERMLREGGVTNMSLMNLSNEWRVVDRSKEPANWGIDPQVVIGMTDNEHQAATESMGEWYSYLGQDHPSSDRETHPPDLADSTDLSLLFGLALLDARIQAYPPLNVLKPAG